MTPTRRTCAYQDEIVRATGCSPATAADIELLMRAEAPTGCLDAMSPRAFRRLAVACFARPIAKAAAASAERMTTEVVVSRETLAKMRERGVAVTVLGPVGQTARAHDVRFLVRVERTAPMSAGGAS